MAKSKRYLKEPRKKKVKLGKYFFIDRRLHKVLRTNAPANLMEAWSFEENCKVTLLYTDYRKLAKKAVSTGQAAEILNVSKRTLTRAIKAGGIVEPKRSSTLNDTNYSIQNMWWSLEDMLSVHDYLLGKHLGRPRHDGGVTPNQNLPTRAEVIAKMTDQMVLYAKEGDRFVPTYLPPQF